MIMAIHPLRPSISITIFSAVIAALPVYGATPEHCQFYANYAISQYHRAKGLEIPNLSHPVWSYSYGHHYEWCLKNTDGVVNNGSNIRETVIKDFCKKTHGYYGKPIGAYKGDPMSHVPSQCLLTDKRTGTPAFQMKAPPPPTSGPTQHQIRPR